MRIVNWNIECGNWCRILIWYEVARPLSINLKGGYHISCPFGYVGWGRVGSGRQGRSPAGESPVVSVARVGHVAISQVMVGNPMSIAWCKRPGCPVAFSNCGGCNLGV
jgi:hypothetical protein